MKRLQNAHARLLIATVVGILASPLTSTALFLQQDAIDTEVAPVDMIERARDDQLRLRAQRRAYWRAIEQYQRARKQGVDAEKPDFNTLDTWQAPEEGVEAVYSAAPMVDSASTAELSTQDRALLRRYTRARSCPDSLKNFRVPGFYELCLRLVGEKASVNPVQGLLNHEAYLRRANTATPQQTSDFKLRLKMLDEALNGTRRDSGVLPGRPTNCVYNTNC